MLLGVLVGSFPAFAQGACDEDRVSIVRNALESRLEAESSAVVWMKSNKQFELDSCETSDDGVRGQGTLSFTGTDGTPYWVKGRVRLNGSGRVVSNEFHDSSNSFQTLAILKAGAVAAAAGGCSASRDCD
mgnify:CR=1 FL=1|tara:strand:- start:137 stop:526 length:390 start_codon:yes stop_codon:yes gene_type:complete